MSNVSKVLNTQTNDTSRNSRTILDMRTTINMVGSQMNLAENQSFASFYMNSGIQSVKNGEIRNESVVPFQ